MTQPIATDPESDPLDEQLPEVLRDRLALAYDVNPPETVGDWAAVVRAITGTEDGVSEDVLCHFSDGDHAVTVDGEEHAFVCVVDPLVLAVLRGRPATIRSETEAGTVRIEVREDGYAVDPADAVVSLGIARDVERGECRDPQVTYEQVCRYIAAFPSREDYEAWAEAVDGVTAAVPPAAAVRMAEALAGTA